jgi:hypothetical protein
MEIEVEWEVRPKSGVTTIDITDMVKDEKSWNKLSEVEKARLINMYLSDSDGHSLKAVSVRWEKI